MWAVGRGPNVKFILGTRPRSWVPSVLEMARCFRQDWSCLNTPASCLLPLQPLAIRYAHSHVICDAFKRTLAPLYQEFLHIFWCECCFSGTSLPHGRTQNPTTSPSSSFPLLSLLIFSMAPRQEPPPNPRRLRTLSLLVTRKDPYGFNRVEEFPFYCNWLLRASRCSSSVLAVSI